MSSAHRRTTGVRAYLSLLLAGIAVAAVAGCGTSADDTAQPAPEGPTTAAATPAAAPAKPTPAPAGDARASSAPKATSRDVGQAAAKTDAVMTANVYGYRQPVAADAAIERQDRVEWGAADVEVCASEQASAAGQVSQLSWSLVYADGTVARPSNVRYPQFPKPGYPVVGTAVKPGSCVRGWITFAVPVGQRPVRAQWRPASEPAPVTWNISPPTKRG